MKVISLIRKECINRGGYISSGSNHSQPSRPACVTMNKDQSVTIWPSNFYSNCTFVSGGFLGPHLSVLSWLENHLPAEGRVGA
jgi:hypothetical protein